LQRARAELKRLDAESAERPKASCYYQPRPPSRFLMTRCCSSISKPESSRCATTFSASRCPRIVADVLCHKPPQQRHLIMKSTMVERRADLIFAHIGSLNLSGANLANVDLSAT
jgi:hypothetical protein